MLRPARRPPLDSGDAFSSIGRAIVCRAAIFPLRSENPKTFMASVSLRIDLKFRFYCGFLFRPRTRSLFPRVGVITLFSFPVIARLRAVATTSRFTFVKPLWRERHTGSLGAALKVRWDLFCDLGGKKFVAFFGGREFVTCGVSKCKRNKFDQPSVI